MSNRELIHHTGEGQSFSRHSTVSKNMEKIYTVFLHVVEGIGLYPKEETADCHRRKEVILHATLNSTTFEVEGHAGRGNTVFSNNCLWEYELAELKRMKTDGRVVKLELFMKTKRSKGYVPKPIGTLLLPLRCVPTINCVEELQHNFRWHKLGMIQSEWRLSKPEVYLLLIAAKTNLVYSAEFAMILGKSKQDDCQNSPMPQGMRDTAFMMQSQKGLHVQLLKDIGLLQVGNDPDVDCEVINVTVILKNVRNLAKVLKFTSVDLHLQDAQFIFQYDFLDSNADVEIPVPEVSNCDTINEKLSVGFKSSLRCLGIYFKRIFYIPMSLYLNEMLIGTCQLDFSKFFPDDTFFSTKTIWSVNSTSYFDRHHEVVSHHPDGPCVDFNFTVERISDYASFHFEDSILALKGASPSQTDFVSYSSKNSARFYQRTASPQLQSQSKCSAIQIMHNYGVRSVPRYHTLSNEQRLSENSVHNHGSVSISSCHTSSSKNCQCVASVHDEHLEIVPSTHDTLNKPTSERGMTMPVLKERLPLEKPALKDVALNTENLQLPEEKLPEKRDACVGTKVTQPVPSNTIGVNTEYLPMLEQLKNDIAFKTAQAVEDGKLREMERYSRELELTKAEYLAALKEDWSRHTEGLTAKVTEKITELEQLNGRLSVKHANLQAKTANCKDSIKAAAELRAKSELEFEGSLKALKLRLQNIETKKQEAANVFDVEQRTSEEENAKLELDTRELKVRLLDLKHQLIDLPNTHLSEVQVKDIFQKMWSQNDNYAKLKHSKDYYKHKWVKATKELHKLELNWMREQHKQQLQDLLTAKKCDQGFRLCPERILSGYEPIFSDEHSSFSTCLSTFTDDRSILSEDQSLLSRDNSIQSETEPTLQRNYSTPSKDQSTICKDHSTSCEDQFTNFKEQSTSEPMDCKDRNFMFPLPKDFSLLGQTEWERR